MGVDLVVVNYRTPGDAQKFVDSVISHPGAAGYFTVWIVDVDPIDRCDSLVERLAVGGVRGEYIPVSYNCGYGRAVNMAVAMGNEPTIGIFNADTELVGDIVFACEESLDAHSDWGVIGPKQVTKGGRITHAGIFGTQTSPKHRGWKEPDRGQFSDIEEAIYVSGSALFMRRAIWKLMADCPQYKAAQPGTWGALLETPHYYEESWLCNHLRHHGYKVIYKGDATMVHEWHKASGHGGWADRQMQGSREIFRATCRAHGIESE